MSEVLTFLLVASSCFNSKHFAPIYRSRNANYTRRHCLIKSIGNAVGMFAPTSEASLPFSNFLNGSNATIKRCSNTKQEALIEAKTSKCDKSYLDFGFTSLGVGCEEKPQCVICLKVN